MGEIGALHFFQSRHLDPDPSQHCIDDTGTPTISWPNYHSGRNGDYQRITPVEPIHPLFRNSAAPSGANAKRATKAVELFPAHPHEGAVGVPAGSKARVIATGTSQTTGRSFNLVVAIDRLGGALRVRAKTADGEPGRAIAQSTFHHFADYNWSIAHGCPSFVTEPVGEGMQTEPSALADIHAYVRNLVAWLAPVKDRVIAQTNRASANSRISQLHPEFYLFGNLDGVQIKALLNWGMICPHPARSFGSGSPLPSLGEGLGVRAKFVHFIHQFSNAQINSPELLELSTESNPEILLFDLS